MPCRTDVFAYSERQKRRSRARRFMTLRKSLRIERLRIRPEPGVSVQGIRAAQRHGALWNHMTTKSIRFRRLPTEEPGARRQLLSPVNDNYFCR
jgi:hypothetical protein